ncbi:MAG: hypothetical protein ACTHK8_06420 [Ginsengibacter sp.]
MKKLISRLSDWYHWPFYLFYSPLFFVWCKYILKSRAIWFFSTSNPRLTFGAFEGESKKEMYETLPESYFPKTIYIKAAEPLQEVESKIQNAQFSYPFIVKPDVGMEAILFRKIDSCRYLGYYHRNMPVDYLIQEFVDYPMEIGLFYYRYPTEKSGVISALFEKRYPAIKGDGISTIRQIAQKQKTSITEELLKLDDTQLDRVLEKNEVLNLSFVGNRYHGATFHDLSDQIDEKLLKMFDEISHASLFYYGRYDIKCTSIDDLKAGRNFSILEFNGAGSIPNHIYTGKYSMWQAYKEISKHWQILYRISRYNNRRGLPYWNVIKGTRFLASAKLHFRFLRKCDKKLVLRSSSAAV